MLSELVWKTAVELFEMKLYCLLVYQVNMAGDHNVNKQFNYTNCLRLTVITIIIMGCSHDDERVTHTRYHSDPLDNTIIIGGPAKA